MEAPVTAPTPLVVLDTNVVLDWLLFADGYGLEVGRAIIGGTLAWTATAAMRDECFEVLARKALARWRPDAAALRRSWDAHCRLRPTPPDAGRPTIRSADADDQMFVDLALAEGAAILLSRDRALLDLAPALRARGNRVMTPAAWVEFRGGRTL